jgi:hypothetical protein
MSLVSCEGYLKNGALASLGLGGGSGAYYGSVGEYYVSQCSLAQRLHGVPDTVHSLDRFIEHALQIPLRQGRALEVLDRLDLLGNLHCLFVLYGLHFTLAQLLFDFWVVAQVELGSDEDDWDAGCVMLYLRVPL